MKRFVSLILCFTLICSIGCFFVSCEKGGEETTELITEAEITEPPAQPPVQIALSELSDFVIVRSDEEYLYTAASKKLEDLFVSKFSFDPDLKSDFVNASIPGYEEAELEILVGPCDRDESRDFVSSLGYRDYGYSMIGTKLVISGVTPEGTLKAVDHFIANVVEKCTAESAAAFYDNAQQSYVYHDEYSDLSINGTPISEYSIVYPAVDKLNEYDIAKVVSTKLATMSGHVLEVKKDTSESAGKEIHIGLTSRDTAPTLADGEFFIGNSGDSIMLYATDTAGLMNAFNAFIDMLEATPSLMLKDTVSSCEASEELVILDYNVWMHTAGQQSRVNSVLDTIEKIAPDIMGLQECTHEWMAFLTDKFSAEYDYVGEGRDGTHTSEDQFNPIFYRKDKFTLIDSGTRWLSDTPEVKYTKVTASAYERIFTFAVLEEKATGVRFVFINTHFDHIGGQAHQASCMAAYISRFYDLPMFMSGDYNGSSMAKRMIGYGYISTKYAASEAVNAGGTHSGGNEIDYIFTNGRGLTVTRYEVMNENESSDHYPVIVKFKFKK